MFTTGRWRTAIGLLLLAVGSSAWGQSPVETREMGLRSGTGDHYDMIEVYGRQSADWVEDDLLRGVLPKRVSAQWDVSLGYWEGRENDSGFFTIGPVFEIQAAKTWYWRLGVQPTLISSHEDAGRDLGGPFQFTSHLGLAWAPPGALVLGVRVQHTSNARLYSSNPGVDTLSLEAGYAF